MINGWIQIINWICVSIDTLTERSIWCFSLLAFYKMFLKQLNQNYYHLFTSYGFILTLVFTIDVIHLAFTNGHNWLVTYLCMKTAPWLARTRTLLIASTNSAQWQVLKTCIDILNSHLSLITQHCFSRNNVHYTLKVHIDL